MSKNSNGLLFVLQAKLSLSEEEDYIFDGTALLETEVSEKIDNASINDVNLWINTVSNNYKGVASEAWVLLPNGSTHFHTIELNTKTAKYAHAVISNHIEPMIATNLEDTKLTYHLEGNTAYTVAISKQLIAKVESCISTLELPVTKLLAPQSLLNPLRSFKEDAPVEFGNYIYTNEEEQIIGVSLDIFCSFNQSTTTRPTPYSLEEVIKGIDSKKIVPNLKANAKKETHSSWLQVLKSWLGLTVIGLTIMTSLAMYTNSVLNNQAKDLNQAVLMQYQTIFPDDRIIDLPRQIKAKINALTGTPANADVTGFLHAIESVLNEVGNNNYIESLSWRRGTALIAWKVTNQQDLKRIEDQIRSKGLSVTLNSWNRLEERTVVGEFEVRVTQ
ncbi:hypothetical protein OFY17_01060 [Marinomonas sp. C2222]|uniref:Type II secretion system protein L n=1 Tax=Marinomonas sargassi TaxID=2984494 RepID=A0ABT2YNK6_9GAMM|nr:GspL/Epsl periplasmic domain-containing protein [Marinomonas sargassi]MCV2401460.1 hypothetical protein [Marinomonas sargassi]